ncbi:MAG TPA: hypothetical protein VMH83_09570 [Candidatus Acidoferrum sp.]|nr:hypothetical protein [Candidatus Acidoferrum sp.]
MTNLLSLKVPTKPDGWAIEKKTTATITLAHADEEPSSSLVAVASSFKVAPPKDKEDFLEQIRRGIDNETPSTRFRELESSLTYEDDRGYQCARYKALHEDRQAKMADKITGTLKLQSHSLYCLHPYYSGVMFVAGYSYRGLAVRVKFDEEAKAFIDSVQPRNRKSGAAEPAKEMPAPTPPTASPAR